MAIKTEAFTKPTEPEEFVLLRVEGPQPGEALDVPAGQYPEAFYRITLRLQNAEDVYRDEPELVRESSHLFWEEGTPARILLSGVQDDGAIWTLSLTRWGVLRWEFRETPDSEPALAVESRAPVTMLVDPAAEFQAGVTIGTGRTTRVSLLAGPADRQPAVVGRADDEELGSLEAVCDRLRVGAGPGGERPVEAEFGGVLVANTQAFAVFGPGLDDAPIDSSFPGGSGLATGRPDAETLCVRPGAEFGSATGNYWHFFRVTDPGVRRVLTENAGSMGVRFFVSLDRHHWEGARQRIVGLGASGRPQLEIALPDRDGPVWVANAPVFGEQERDRSLRRAEALGATVKVAGQSAAGLPIHIVSLTDADVPLEDKVGVIMLCGQHSPLEQMGGWLGLPLIEELCHLDREGETKGLLQRLALYWVPILNVDCAHFGTPGNTLYGTNPNRKWMHDQGPEQRAVEQFFLQEREAGLRPGLMMDIHGGGGWRNHNILSDYQTDRENVPDDGGLEGADRLKPEWFALLDEVAGLREVWRNGHISGPVRAPDWFQRNFGCPAMTLECSVVSYLDPTTRRTRTFTLESYLELGRNLARAFARGEGPLRQGARRVD